MDAKGAKASESSSENAYCIGSGAVSSAATLELHPVTLTLHNGVVCSDMFSLFDLDVYNYCCDAFCHVQFLNKLIFPSARSIRGVTASHG